MDSLSKKNIAALKQLCPGGVAQRVSLAQLSQWRVGGLADVIASPTSTQQVAALRRFFNEAGIAHLVIGQTTNLLFADEGLRAPCIMIGSRMSGVTMTAENIYAQSGVWVPNLARQAMKAGLTGIEHICGIPGTLGGLVCMNGGSQRQGVGSSVSVVQSVDSAGVIRKRKLNECGFSYRSSVFQSNDEIVTDVQLQLKRGCKPLIRHEMLEILAERRHKFPRRQPNCGSVFVSDPALYDQYGPPGRIIEYLGFKGHTVGGAKVSERHANFIVNIGNARALDILTIISEIRAATERYMGRPLVSEVRYVSQDGKIRPASDAI